MLNWEFIVDKLFQLLEKLNCGDLSFLFITPSDFFLYLNSIKSSKVAGPNGVSPFLLRKYSHVLAEPFPSLFHAFYKKENCLILSELLELLLFRRKVRINSVLSLALWCS